MQIQYSLTSLHVDAVVIPYLLRSHEGSVPLHGLCVLQGWEVWGSWGAGGGVSMRRGGLLANDAYM